MNTTTTANPGIRLEDLGPPSALPPPSPRVLQRLSSATTVNGDNPGSTKGTWRFPSRRDPELQPPELQPPDALPAPTDLSIESRYRRGYPVMAAFMDLEPKFDMFRRFGRLHIRTLLYKQDELSELEERLERLDAQEEAQLNLSSRRHDANPVRRELLVEIEQKLVKYDEALLRHQTLLNLRPVTPRNVESYTNWMDGTRPLVKSETGFMQYMEDFVPSSQNHPDYGFLDSAIQWLLPKLCCGCTRLLTPPSLRQRSTYAYLHLYSTARLGRLTRLLVTLLAVKSLLVPIVLLYYIKASQARLFIVLSFTLAISLMLAGLTRASRYEIFAATAGYCAVLVVFLGSVS